jgi:hypothetical protein
MEKELIFLKTWGLAFRQAFKDNPTMVEFRNREEMCLDAYNQISKGKSLFETDLTEAFSEFRAYIELLNKQRAFSPQLYFRHVEMLDSIEARISCNQLVTYENQ